MLEVTASARDTRMRVQVSCPNRACDKFLAKAIRSRQSVVIKQAVTRVSHAASYARVGKGLISFVFVLHRGESHARSEARRQQSSLVRDDLLEIEPMNFR
jgi:hypothetical protein